MQYIVWLQCCFCLACSVKKISLLGPLQIIPLNLEVQNSIFNNEKNEDTGVDELVEYSNDPYVDGKATNAATQMWDANDNEHVLVLCQRMSPQRHPQEKTDIGKFMEMKHNPARLTSAERIIEKYLEITVARNRDMNPDPWTVKKRWSAPVLPGAREDERHTYKLSVYFKQSAGIQFEKKTRHSQNEDNNQPYVVMVLRSVGESETHTFTCNKGVFEGKQTKNADAQGTNADATTVTDKSFLKRVAKSGLVGAVVGAGSGVITWALDKSKTWPSVVVALVLFVLVSGAAYLWFR